MPVGIRTYDSLHAELAIIALKRYGAKVGLLRNFNQARHVHGPRTLMLII